MMFGSSLPSIVCRRDHVLFTFFVLFVFVWCVHNVVSFSGLSILDCPFLIAHSVLSNIYIFPEPELYHKLKQIFKEKKADTEVVILGCILFLEIQARIPVKAVC